jgi:hypothetical protein
MWCNSDVCRLVTDTNVINKWIAEMRFRDDIADRVRTLRYCYTCADHSQWLKFTRHTTPVNAASTNRKRPAVSADAAELR